MIPWRRDWLPTLVLLPGEFHGQRRLASYSPLSCRVGQNGMTNTHSVPLRTHLAFLINLSTIFDTLY